jgi:hypothetical protein
MCAGQMDQAKQAFDQVLEALELKVQTTDLESKHLLPTYLVNLLVYFYIKTSKIPLFTNSLLRELQDGTSTAQIASFPCRH